ncbi:MAG: isocitrate lyase/phosphoenolpyruvate mutase family protein [Phenylobacterium sp.]|uniref:isocitrate lyase/PEP mutase family protein n=1 Tax=Phenylobacterium sp. TaxID=1871053 RepID=UPI001A3CFD08|nr:isocitrate lyase/phosphoenolpyruvate mutase family protein [Phenylobacterium sp.]MBL8772753.1 isocitrate lyase/phosphoenolpyruvate mutase family protein [Phenylobacterium sp.]
MDQAAKARAFHELHQGPEVLVLANVWDAASAATVEAAGAKALATSSAAVAWAHGYADGDVLAVETTCRVVAEIVRITDLPVSCDFEGGFTDDLGVLADNIRRVIDAGAVGINFEDGGRDPELHARKVAAARAAAGTAGVDLFINARTDVYLRQLAQGDAAEAEAIRRGRLYADAGASGVFTPGAADPELIRRLAAALPLPLNVMAWPGVPDAATLASLGARRLSAGTGTFRAAFAALAKSAAAFLETGDVHGLGAAGDGAPALQKRFSGG